MTDLINPDSFLDPVTFWTFVRHNTGDPEGHDRTDIPATVTPLVYTELENRIEELRQMIVALEARMDFWSNVWLEKERLQCQKSSRKSKPSKLKP